MARDQNLYSRNGAFPLALPLEATDESGFTWTQPMEADALAACGFVPADDPPEYDPSTQALSWQDGAWGVVALPPPAPLPLPVEVPMYKVEKLLVMQGLLDQVVDHLEGLAEPNRTLALIDWKRAPNLVVGSPLALGAKAALGLTDEQYDTLVRAADALP